MQAKTQNFIFAQLKGSPMNTAGWNLQGAAAVTNVVGTGDSELLLCPARNGLSGAAFFNSPINLSVCSAWKAEFDFRIYDGTAADGIAFCFLDVPPVGFVTGAGLGIPATANGLKICFDTYDNCNPNTTYQMPKVEIRWGSGYNECWSQPTAANEGGFLNFIRSPRYAHAIVGYDNGNITVTVNGTQLVTGYQQFNFSGYLGFTSSTGGQNDNQSIKNVIIYTQMPPSVAGGAATAVCPGDTVKLGTANNTQYTYSWSPAAGLSSTTISNPYAIASNNTGNILYQKYYVKTSYNSNAGCASEDSTIITVNPYPLVGFDTPVICLPNGSITLHNTTAIYDSTQSQITYQWQFSNGGTSNQTNPLHNFDTAGKYTVDVKTVSSKGCTNELSKTFIVSPRAKAYITLPAEFCQDSLITFTGNAPGLTVQSWHWAFGDNVVDSVQNPKHTYRAAATYMVSLSAITNQGCLTDTPTATIAINPLPVAAFTVTGINCQNQLLHFVDVSTALVGNIATRNWHFDDGTTSAAQSIDHGFAQYGTHMVTLTVQNSKGCFSKADTVTKTINPTPLANFGPPNVCKGANGMFTDSSTIVDGTQSQFGYQWFFGDGSIGTGSNPAHVYVNAGNYNTQLVVTSNNGCTDTVAKTFAVSDYPVVNVAVITTDFCGSLPLQLRANASVNFGNIDHLKIFWDFPSTPDSTVVTSPLSGTIYTHNYTTFGYTNAKQVSLLVQGFSSGGCYSQNTSTSILFASPKLVFSPIPTFCENNSQPVLLNEARDTTIFAGSGFYTGPGVSNGYFTPSAAGPGKFNITYTYTLVNGCSDTAQQVVQVAVQPTVSAGQQTIILQGGQIVLQGAAAGGDSLTYAWVPPATLNNPTLLQPLATPAVDTYYTLTATNSNGCYDTAGVLIKVLQYPLVPNAFSPNGDGINDNWQIAYLNSYPDCKVEVFNRYGQLVFSSTGYQIPWNGTYNGNPLPVGTYYYIVSTSHLPKPLSGPVTIIR